jgi:hypothetical protein
MHQAARYLVLIILSLGVSAASAGEAPITGARFESLLSNQRIELQHTLQKQYPESEGYLITGPLDPMLNVDDELGPLFSSIRVICPDLIAYDKSIASFPSSRAFDVLAAAEDAPESYVGLTDHCGTVYTINWNNRVTHVHIVTVQQTRYLIWLRTAILNEGNLLGTEGFRNYSVAVSHYLCSVDSGLVDAEPPKALDHRLPDNVDLYANAPDYIIQGYQNYKAFLKSHSELKTDFARGILAFVPTVETLQWFKEIVPKEAFPNKEAAKLQEEYHTFFARGGGVRIMETLTTEGFDTLRTGEYFFAVSVSGKIRFGRELLREEVRRLEHETGRKVPRGNHAFLLPGEPVLTAGAFFIDDTETSRLVEVNAQSGHYFYSNITETIREDISERSDYYLLTLGHFFRALDRIEIPYEGVLIRKF